jgi:hypothetical protein
MYIIKKLLNWIRIILLIIKIFNIEDLFHNLFNEVIFKNIVEDNEAAPENKKEEKNAYNEEVHRNSLILKFMGAVTFICWLKLSKDEMGYVFLAVILSEILEKIVEKTK